MFDLEKSIQRWVQQFRKHRAFYHGNIHEMELHLRDHIEDLMAAGHSESSAFATAVKDFGEVQPMADEEYTNIKTKTTIKTMIKAAMFKNYFKISFRSLRRSPITSFINIFGLSAAIGICLTIYAFIDFDVKTDRFHENAHEVFLATYYVDREGVVEHYGPSPAPLGAMIREDFTRIKGVCRIEDRNYVIKQGNNVFHERVRFADPEFLQMLTFPLKSGVPASLRDVNSVILSHEMASKFFGDADPLGKSLSMKINDERSKSFVVTGVAAPFPNERIIDFDFLVNFENLMWIDSREDIHDWGKNISATLVQVEDAGEIAIVQAGMDKYKQLQNAVQDDWAISHFEFISLYDLHLAAGGLRDGISFDYSAEGRYSLPVFGLFFLLLACFNYINIAIVTASKRLKEIGLRKVMGANRRLVVIQFLSENLVTTLMAMFIGVAMALIVFLPWMSERSGSVLVLDLLDLRLWFFGLGIMVLTALLSGLYPAFYISRYQAVSIFQGSVRFGRKNPLTKLFLGFQLILACTGITGAIVFSLNSTYQKNRSWGYDHQQVIFTPVHSSSAFDQLEFAMSQNPKVMTMTGSVGHIGRQIDQAVIHRPDRQYEVDVVSVGHGYQETLGIQLKEGRFFNTGANADRQKVVVNETFVSNLALDQPLGEAFRMDSLRYEIIGVVEDFQINSFYENVSPTMFVLSDPSAYQYLTLRAMNGHEAEVFADLKVEWARLFPEIPFQGDYQSQVWSWFFEQVETQEKFYQGIAFIAVLLAALGLYGLVTLNVQGRIREFSIRKTLGADFKDLTTTIIKYYMILATVALVVGAPLSYYLIKANVDMMYKNPVPMGYGEVAMAALILVFVLLGVISTQVWKVLRANPVDGLRVE